MKAIQYVLAAVYFIMFMFPTLFLLAFFPLILWTEIQAIRGSGFSIPVEPYWAIAGLLGFCIGLSLLVPAFRKMYSVFPWLFPFVKIMYINLLIGTVALLILNYGYEVQDSARHTLFFVLMLAQIIVCRLAMGFYFYKRPATYEGDGHER